MSHANGLGAGKFNVYTGSTLNVSWSIDSISGADTFQISKWEMGMSRFASAANPMIVKMSGPSGDVTVKTIATTDVTAAGGFHGLV